MIEALAGVLGVVVCVQAVLLWRLTRPGAREASNDPLFEDVEASPYGTDGFFRGLPEDVVEVWALSPAGWVQCQPTHGGWTGPWLQGASVSHLRLWRGAAGQLEATRGSGMLVAPALWLARSGAGDVGARRAEDEAEAFSAALVEATAVGWTPTLPNGAGWAQRAQDLPADAFARELCIALERAVTEGLTGRPVAEARQLVVARVHGAAARLASALYSEIELIHAPPRAVGPRQQEQWLVDDDVATRIDNAPVEGVVQPVIVLRPTAQVGGQVILEGVVA